MKSIQTYDIDQENIYNPMEGIFKLQNEEILNEIRELIINIQNMKVNSLGRASSSVKYKITE